WPSPGIIILTVCGAHSGSPLAGCVILHIWRGNKNNLSRILSRACRAQFVEKKIVCSSTAWSVQRVRCSQRILAVLGVVRVHRIHDLRQIVFCLRLFGLILDGLKSREEQANQNRDNRDNDKQFNKREGSRA